MDKADLDLQLLRYWIRDEFTRKLTEVCNLRTRQCRGGSRALYNLILRSPATYQYLKTDPEHLQIVSGIGHTFIRYKDDEHERYIYIDPTIGQFVPSFDGIFVGTRAELESLGGQLNIKNYVEDPEWTKKTHPPLQIENTLMKGGNGSNISCIGALNNAVKSGNLSAVKTVGNAMMRNGWTVNWMKHAQTANEMGRLSIRNYLTRKATENARSKSALKRRGGRRQSRRRYSDRR